MVCPYSGILFGLNRKVPVTCYTINFNDIMLSEIASYKDNYCMIPLLRGT